MAMKLHLILCTSLILGIIFGVLVVNVAQGGEGLKSASSATVLTSVVDNYGSISEGFTTRWSSLLKRVSNWDHAAGAAEGAPAADEAPPDPPGRFKARAQTRRGADATRRRRTDVLPQPWVDPSTLTVHGWQADAPAVAPIDDMLARPLSFPELRSWVADRLKLHDGDASRPALQPIPKTCADGLHLSPSLRTLLETYGDHHARLYYNADIHGMGYRHYTAFFCWDEIDAGSALDGQLMGTIATFLASIFLPEGRVFIFECNTGVPVGNLVWKPCPLPHSVNWTDPNSMYLFRDDIAKLVGNTDGYNFRTHFRYRSARLWEVGNASRAGEVVRWVSSSKRKYTSKMLSVTTDLLTNDQFNETLFDTTWPIEFWGFQPNEQKGLPPELFTLLYGQLPEAVLPNLPRQPFGGSQQGADVKDAPGPWTLTMADGVGGYSTNAAMQMLDFLFWPTETLIRRANALSCHPQPCPGAPVVPAPPSGAAAQPPATATMQSVFRPTKKDQYVIAVELPPGKDRPETARLVDVANAAACVGEAVKTLSARYGPRAEAVVFVSGPGNEQAEQLARLVRQLPHLQEAKATLLTVLDIPHHIMPAAVDRARFAADGAYAASAHAEAALVDAYTRHFYLSAGHALVRPPPRPFVPGSGMAPDTIPVGRTAQGWGAVPLVLQTPDTYSNTGNNDGSDSPKCVDVTYMPVETRSGSQTWQDVKARAGLK